MSYILLYDIKYMIVDLKKYIVLTILFTIVDFIYLYSSSGHFNSLISKIQKSPIEMDKYALVLCYLSLTIGLYYYESKLNLYEIFALGIFVYSVYEFTNKAIFTDWTWMTVIFDSIWGGILFASVVFIYRKIFEK